MASENLERLRQGQEGFSRGDLSFTQELAADDIDWGTTGSFPGLDESYRGREGMDRWMDTVRSAWESFEVSIADVLLDTGDVIAVEERLRGRGRGSGVEVEMGIFAVYWFDGARILRRRVFEDRGEAIQAAGGSGG